MLGGQIKNAIGTEYNKINDVAVNLIPQSYTPGAHNDNEEEEGKGRSAKRPRERLKFQNFPTVVALLSLEQWRTRKAQTGQLGRVSIYFFCDRRRSRLLLARLGWISIDF